MHNIIGVYSEGDFGTYMNSAGMAEPMHFPHLIQVVSKLQIRGSNHIIFILFLHENVCCGYSLEVPR